MSIKGQGVSTKDEAENLAKENGITITTVGSNSELRDVHGTLIASDITVRLWHRIIELFKIKK